MHDYLRLEVVGKRQETPTTVTLSLRPCDGPVEYQAGQFLTFLFDKLSARPIRRSYSLSSCPGVDADLQVTVQKQVNGLASRFLHDRVVPGDFLVSLPPAGKFVLPGEVPPQLVLFGGGSGVTPLFGLLKDVLHHHPETRVLMLDANRNEEHIIFRDILTQYAVGWPERFSLRHFLSMPVKRLSALDQELGPAIVRWGRLSNAIMEQILDDFGRQDPANTLFYLCGPPALLLKAREVLGYLGFNEDQVLRELFTLRPPYRPKAERYPNAIVRLEQHGEIYRFPVPAGQTILEAAEAAGLSLPYSCRSGSCTTCIARCLEGRVEMFTPDGRIDSHTFGGEALTCVGYPETEEVTLRIP